MNSFLHHPFLGDAARHLPSLVMASRADNTNKKYKLYFEKFSHWCSLHNLTPLPASPSIVSIYLSSLVQQRVSTSVLDSAFYSINRYHEISSLKNPCDNRLVKLAYEGGKRLLCRPVNKKNPITIDILEKMIDRFGNDSQNILNLRLCVLCLLGFSGFFRYSELSNIKLKDLCFEETHVVVQIGKSKTDIYRQGASVIIARTGNKLCPVYWLKRYIEAAKFTAGSDQHLFTSVQFCRSSGLYKVSGQCLSYTRAREILLDALEVLGYDKSKYSLHSLRSGGVSAAASNNVSDRLLRAHGRWATDKSKDGYIEDSLSNRLLVSRNLNL